MAGRMSTKRGMSVPPKTPPPKSNNKKPPSTVGAKNRYHACIDDDYIANLHDDDGNLICNGIDNLYFYKSKFDKLYKNQGEFCCEKNTIPHTQYDKQKEALYRQFLFRQLNKYQIEQDIINKIYKNLQKFTKNTKSTKRTRSISISNNNTDILKNTKKRRHSNSSFSYKLNYNNKLNFINKSEPILVSKAEFEKNLLLNNNMAGINWN